MGQILPSEVQHWVTTATSNGLSPRSLRKYHTMLHSIFKRALRDQLVASNPCEHTELPKVIARKSRTLTPTSSTAIMARSPTGTGSWSRPRSRPACAGESSSLSGPGTSTSSTGSSGPWKKHIIEVSRKHSPTGAALLAKPYPKDNEPRTMGIHPPGPPARRLDHHTEPQSR